MENEQAKRDAVTRGARLLDEQHPDWWQKVNTDTLRMASCTECVLGQVLGGFWTGMDVIKQANPHTPIDPSLYGFDAWLSEDLNYDQLLGWWTEEIEARKAVHAQT